VLTHINVELASQALLLTSSRLMRSVALRHLSPLYHASIRPPELPTLCISARLHSSTSSYSTPQHHAASRPVSAPGNGASAAGPEKEKDASSATKNGKKAGSHLTTGAVLTVLATVGTTAVSYFITERNREDALRKSQLERVSEQLSKLYGPMFARAAANDAAWKLYFAKYIGDGEPALPDSAWTVEQQQHWAHWMSAVFMKYNRRLSDVILKHTDLLVEDTMPHCLLQLLVHTEGYEVILERWKSGDFKQLHSLISINADVVAYAEKNYASLKAQQCRLLSRTWHSK
jgi:hypothetical protein